LNWQVLGVVGLVSLITMPVTAIWFLFLGSLTFVTTAVYAAILRSPERTAAVLRTGTSIGVGLLIGPVVYLSLAAVT
jgi:hypothetical protein